MGHSQIYSYDIHIVCRHPCAKVDYVHLHWLLINETTHLVTDMTRNMMHGEGEETGRAVGNVGAVERVLLAAMTFGKDRRVKRLVMKLSSTIF